MANHQAYELDCLNTSGVTLLADDTETDPLIRELKTKDRLRIDKNTADIDSLFLRISDLEEQSKAFVQQAQVTELVNVIEVLQHLVVQMRQEMLTLAGVDPGALSDSQRPEKT